jgi:hypothetical protein
MTLRLNDIRANDNADAWARGAYVELFRRESIAANGIRLIDRGAPPAPLAFTGNISTSTRKTRP